VADLELVKQIGAANHGLAIVSVARPDGSVHSSLVNAGLLEHPTKGTPVVGLVIGGATKKLRLLRAAGRATLSFQDGWQWVSVEGPIDAAGPDDTDVVAPDQVPELLRAVFRAAGGTHDDWDEYDRVMAAERRTAVLVTPARIISNG
jgi:PPOX class probable F420-dependent enzyme